MGVNHGNIYTFTEPRSVSHSQETLVSDSENHINAATATALDHALIKAQRCLDMVQDITSENTQIIGVAKRLDTLLLETKDLNSEQWGVLENEVVTTVLSLLYCCTMECYELRSTPLTISSLCDQLDACNLALQRVYGAAMKYVPFLYPVLQY